MENEEKIEREYFECECYTTNHIMVVEKDPEWGTTIFVQVRPMSFWRRLRYLFSGDSHDMWMSATIARKEDRDRFLKLF